MTNKNKSVQRRTSQTKHRRIISWEKTVR